MTKTKVSYKLTAFADERKVSEREVDTIKDLHIELGAFDHYYKNRGNFDSIQVIIYIDGKSVSEEWINM